MEYDFHKNIYGECEARLSMGHEAFGAWINDALTSAVRCQQILSILTESTLKSQSIASPCGHYTLTLQEGEAGIECHSLSNEGGIEDAELDYYDDELKAQCGLEDLVEVIAAWEKFIAARQ